MLAKKDTFGNWTERHLYGGYCLVDKKTKFNWYSMQTPKELFDAIGKEKIFSILDLKSEYHQLPLRFEDSIFENR
jgi:hypothetical protein